MIIIVDDVIPFHMANYIQNFAVNQMNSNFQIWGDTKTIDSRSFPEDKVINEALQLITNTASKYYSNVELDWAQIVEWPVGASQALHVDSASNKTVLSSITYLNNNFRGGETIFEDGTTVAPVPGRTVFFNGVKYVHGVHAVSNASRFTIPIWYKSKII